MRIFTTQPHSRSSLLSLLLGVLFAGSIFFSPTLAVAEANPEINYQGKLTTPSGVAVPDGTYNMRFWLISSSTAATTSAEWTEELTGADKVQVVNGLFSVMLGSTTPLTSVDFNQTLYLGVEIGGTSTPAWDGEMSPRKVLGMVPAAFVANTALSATAASSADALSGLASSSFLRADAADTMEATSSSPILSVIQNGAGAIARFFSGVTEVFTILGNGNVGIGTSTPSQALTVAGEALVTGTSTLATTSISSLSLGSALSSVNGGTGLSSITQNQLLIGGAGNTWTQIATSSLGLGNGTFLGLSDTPSAYTANRLFFTNSGATAVTDSANLTFDGSLFAVGGGITATASSTIGGGTTTSGLTILGNSTTTLNANIGGALVVSSTTASSSIANVLSIGSGGPTLGYAQNGLDISRALTISGSSQYANLRNLTNLTTSGGFFSSEYNYIRSSSGTGSSDVVGSINSLNFETGVTSATAKGFIANISKNNSGAAATFTNITGFESNLNLNDLSNGVTVTNMYGSRNYLSLQSPGTVTNAYGTNNYLLHNSSGGSLTNYYGSYSGLFRFAGTVSNAYGFYADLGTTYASNTYGVYVNGGTQSYFGGNVGIGSTTPSYKLTVVGDSYIGGNLTATGTLSITGAAALSSTLNVTGLTTLSSASTTNLSLSGYLYDSVGSGGTSGMVLQTTGTSTRWVATSSLGISGASTFLALTDTPSSYTANRLFFTNSGATAVTDSADLVFTGTNFGIGSTTPSARLTIVGAAGSANTLTIASSTGSTTLALLANGNLELPGQLISAGINWTSRSAPEANTWNSVTYGNGLFVAVCSDDEEYNPCDTVMTSPDGITWATTSAAEANYWSSVTYGNGLFVAVAGSGTNRVMTSPDGITWTARTAAEANYWNSVTYGNGLFVAVSQTGTNRVMTSPDGITWTARTAAEANYWNSVTYGNGLFVAVSYSGTNRVMTSPDGITWTARTAAEANSWISVTYGNGLFVAVAGSGTNRVMTSGISSRTELAHNNIYQGGTTFMGGLRAGTTSTSVASIFLQSQAGVNPFAVASSTGTQLLTLTQAGKLGIGSSTPAELLTVGGNTYIDGTLGLSGAASLASSLSVTGLTTLTNASTTNLSLSGYLYDSVGNGGTSGMVLQTTGTSTRWVATSSLGISGASTFLALTDTPSSYTANRLFFTNSGATAVTDSADLVFTGTNFGIGSTTPSARLTIVGAAGSANTLTIASSTGSTTLALLANGNLELPGQLISAGINWTARQHASSTSYYSVAYGGNLFVAVGEGAVMRSSDGVNWASSTPAEYNTWTSVTYGNGLFVAVSSNGTNRVMTSPDGITWTARNAAEANYWSSVTYGNGLFVAVSSTGTNRVMTSPDGITWTARAAAQANSWLSVTYGNGLFVAVSSNGTNRVMTSPDGITWTARSAAEALSWTSVTYGNGLFVAVGFSGTNRVMTSPDGITWTGRTAAEAGFWRGITYGNGLFVAVSNSGTDQVMTSPDGITWKGRKAAEANSWRFVTYGNGLFVAVSWDGTNRVMTSGISSRTELAHNNIYQGGTTFMGGLRAGTTSASVASIFLQSQAGINPFAIASSTGTQLLTLTQAGALGLGTSTPSGLGITIERTGLSGTTTAGITQYLTFANSVASAQQFGNNTYMRTTNTATTTLVGSILRIEDSTTYGNTVRGLEVQTERGNNTLGENTAISGFARTFGVRGVTEGNAGATFEPAGVYGETRGTTQGNALRGYSSSITTAALLKLFQDTSTFTGTGLLMNFGNSGGSFSSTTASRFIDLQNAGTSRFTVGAYGMLTIGDGTMGTNAGIQIGYGGLCVDDDGSCNASTTGRISAEEYHTGNSDLAEMYFGDASLAAGEIVYLKGGLSIGKASQETADRIFGVISTKPGLLLGYDDSSLREGEVGHPIALSGRVPIKLSNENGPIKTGDELMLSSIPGVAMKASSTGVVVGIALEDFDETRAYSDTYINQFGENIIVPRFTPINQVTDPRINDGCYYGGGVAAGEAPCVPLQTETEDEQVAEANALAAAEAKADALAALALVPSETVTLAEREVQVGQIVMFVDLRYRYLDAESSTMLAALMATTTAANDAVETIWQRLVILAENFIDGVLSVFTLKADRVETKELCVDGVCVDAENLRTLLNQSAGTPVESTIETNDDEVVVTVIGGGEDTTATSTETGGDVVSPSAESDGNGTTTDAASTTEQTGAEPVVTEEGESEDIPAEDEPAEPLPEVVEEEQEVTEDETVRDEDGAQETENGGETAASTDGATVAE